jgi:hypothetical protein
LENVIERSSDDDILKKYILPLTSSVTLTVTERLPAQIQPVALHCLAHCTPPVIA